MGVNIHVVYKVHKATTNFYSIITSKMNLHPLYTTDNALPATPGPSSPSPVQGRLPGS